MLRLAAEIETGRPHNPLVVGSNPTRPTAFPAPPAKERAEDAEIIQEQPKADRPAPKQKPQRTVYLPPSPAPKLPYEDPGIV